MRKTLTLRDGEGAAAPRAKGGGIATSRLDTIHARAREMRRNPSPAEALLWEHLSNGSLGGAKFRRQYVLGTKVLDFLCEERSLAIEIDDAAPADPVDRVPADPALAIVRVAAKDVLADPEAVLRQVRQALETRPVRRPRPERYAR